MNWIVEAVVIHMLFLGSIFVIYFRSPIILNLQPQSDLIDSPAKRLVLIVTDGLRADSFFSNECQYVPYIKKIFTTQGILGISHTRVPTESRPGHIALIAGLYEDPSAVTKGWRENPVDFDTVFNRSEQTFAWGSYDIVSIFAKADYDKKLTSFTYDDPHDFSGKNRTYHLDMWVFSKVKSFLANNFQNLKEKTKIIFFLHLLGLDSAGHIYKPGSELFNENLKITDNGIYEMYNLFEEYFTDGRTAYILTSDHGMTDKGSHGAGDPYETETPLMAWGAGVHYWKNTTFEKTNSFFHIGRDSIPLIEIKQADIAPLMSTLIGTAVPVNNYGQFPKEVLKSSEEYLSKSVLNNALQILAQYEMVLNNSQQGWFSNMLPSYEKLTISNIKSMQALNYYYIDNAEYKDSVQLSEKMIAMSLEGIEYYQTYFKRGLLFCTMLSFLAWIYYLLVMLQKPSGRQSLSKKTVYYGCFVLVIAIEFLIVAQKIPQSIGFYLVLPVICWGRVLLKNEGWNPLSYLKTHWLKWLGLLIGVELMVLSFYHREIISVVLLVFTLSKCISFKNVCKLNALLYYKWIFSAMLLCVFPFIPTSYGMRHDGFFLFGGILWLFNLFAAAKDIRNKNIMVLFCLIGFGNCLISLYCYNKDIGVSGSNRILSWLLTGLAYVGPIFSDSQQRHRNNCIYLYLVVPYFHLSVSYEIIFFAILGTNILSYVELETEKNCQQMHGIIGIQKSKKEAHLTDSFNISFVLLLFILISFFGTGNIASISSFDPNVVRFYLITFSPFTMMGLIILKLVIPILLIISTLIGLAMQLKVNERTIFLSLLFICDMMALNFLFMVTNKGSWLEIGMSISHFVIIEVTILVLALMTYVAKPLAFIDLSYTFVTNASKLK